MTVPFKDWLAGLSAVTPNDVDLFYIYDNSGDLSGKITWQSIYTLAVAAATAADLSIVDSGALYTATDVEAALAEVMTAVNSLSFTAASISVADSGALYTATDVEDALAEVKTLADANAAKYFWDQAQTLNAQTGTTYTPVAGDMGKVVTLSNASDITLTIPQDSDLGAWSIGKTVEFIQLGAGQVTVTAGTGTTLRTSGLTNKSRAQYSRFAVQKIAADTFSVFGDLALS
jgi:hypothetical protein